MILLLIVSSLFAADPNLVFKNNQAAGDLMSEENANDAKRLLEKEIVNYPFAGELHYNLGVANETVDQKDKAIQEYLAAAQLTQEDELKFQSFFNAAKISGDKGDIPGALKYYQMALGIKPDSQEVKTNIELLFQGGEGKGSSNQDKKNDKQDQEGQKQSQNQQKPDEKQNGEKKQPRQFKSEQLSERDVKNILEEIKRQEEQIRAKMMNKTSKESPVEKDW